MNMEQLLQHYQEVSKKAVLNNNINEKPLHSYQLEKLQIEDALYGHWERNVMEMLTVGEHLNGVGKETPYKYDFNEWLQDELDKLDE